MKKAAVIVFVILFGSISNGNAFHIVGGDFQYEWISGNDFKITLKLFRDCSGTGAGFDASIKVGVYDQFSNSLQNEFTMPLESVGNLSLSGSLCSPPPSVCVEVGTYFTTVTLPNNVNGYYLIWERCCRNSVVQNINLPDQTGMAFYLEMPDPALQNSSPQFLSDPLPYMCEGQPFLYNFNTIDPDGDSLVFELVNPKAGHTSSSSPNGGGNDPTSPGPYPDIAWQAPFNLANLAGGIPLAIDANNGNITAVPNFIGIFAMAIDVKEFRNGVQIGLIKREIQFSVIACVDNAQPTITNNGVNAVYNLLPGDTLNITVGAQDSDPGDSLWLFVSGDNLPGSSIAPPYALAQNDSGIGYASSPVFWVPTCDHSSATPYTMTFFALDNGCPQNLFKVGNIEINVGGYELPNTISIDCAEALSKTKSILYLNNLPPQQVSGMKYHLYRSVNGAPFTVYDSITHTGSNFDYVDSLNVDFTNNYYCYFILGKNSCDVNGQPSDTICIYGPGPPELYIQSVSVPNNQDVELKWDFVSGMDKQDLKIYRKEAGSSQPYAFYASINDSTVLDFVDDTTNVHAKSYCYRIVQNLPCGMRLNVSKETCSILLSGKQSGNRNLLNWTSYLNWKNGVESYEVYKIKPGTTEELVAVVTSGQLTYIDTDFDAAELAYSYIVLANERNSSAVSKSNIISLEDIVVYVPNAFSPNGDGKNETWGPIQLNLQNYQLQIYNRYGMVIFESDDPLEQWDGAFKGQQAKEDNYIYVIRYWNPGDGRMKIQKGNLVLLR